MHQPGIWRACDRVSGGNHRTKSRHGERDECRMCSWLYLLNWGGFWLTNCPWFWCYGESGPPRTQMNLTFLMVRVVTESLPINIKSHNKCKGHRRLPPPTAPTTTESILKPWQKRKATPTAPRTTRQCQTHPPQTPKKRHHG